MYSQWLYDQEEMHKMYNHYATYVGMFSNYEMAKSLMNIGKTSHKSSNDSFDESCLALENMNDDKLLAAQQIAASRKNRKVVR